MLLKYAGLLLSLVVLPILGHPKLYTCYSDLTAMPNIDVDKIVGDWYSTKMYYDSDGSRPMDQLEKICAKTSISKWENGTLSVLDPTTTVVDGSNITISLTLGRPSHPPLGKFQAVMKVVVDSKNINIPIPVWILDTDYNTYAVFANCVSIEKRYFDAVSIMSRTPTLSPDSEAKINAIIGQHVKNHNVINYTYSEASCSYAGQALHT